ncbi:MAG: hypothetical protein H0Z29_03060 [Candidatus Marinimicrobia bacterium]|nr:hypothetical protein [Candidatus Neomarinimicrobiota bacterium]
MYCTLNRLLKIIIIALTIIINVEVYLFGIGIEGVYYLKGIKESYITILESSTRKTYFMEWEKIKGFSILDSLKIDKSAIDNGVYNLTQTNNRLLLKNYYPRDIISKSIIIETNFVKRKKYPAIYLESKNLVTFLEFLQNSNGNIFIVDTIKFIDDDTYGSKIHYWNEYLKEFVNRRYSRDPEEVKELYSIYYRDSIDRGLSFKKSELEIDKNTIKWLDVNCDSAMVFQQGEFAYLFAKFSILTDKVVKNLNSYYVLLPEKGKWKIIYEEEKVISLTIISELLEDFVRKWLDSWMKLDINKYENFYDDSFKSGKFNYKKWIDYKINVFSKLNWVDIKAENLVILSEDKYLWRVEFLQHYKSDKSSDLGYKILYIRGTPGEFKIVEEIWMPVKKN